MTAEVRDLMRQVPLYRRLSEEDRSHLAAMTSVRTYEKGDVVFAEADVADQFFHLVEGRVKILR